MTQDKRYDTQEIDQLKQKIKTYKEILAAIKTGDTVEGYLLLKNDWLTFKNKVSTLEGAMKLMEKENERQEQKYLQEGEQLSAQIDSVNHSVNLLQKDIELMKAKIDQIQINELLYKMNHMIDMQQTLLNEEKQEKRMLTEEITELKEQMKTKTTDKADQQARPKASSYRQLQNMIQSSKQIQYPKDKSSDPFNRHPGTNMSQHPNNINPPQRSPIYNRNIIKKKRVLTDPKTNSNNKDQKLATSVTEEDHKNTELNTKHTSDLNTTKINDNESQKSSEYDLTNTNTNHTNTEENGNEVGYINNQSENNQSSTQEENNKKAIIPSFFSLFQKKD